MTADQKSAAAYHPNDGPVGEVPPEVSGWREGMPNAHAYCASTISALRYDLGEAREGFDRWREIGNVQAARADAAEARLRAVEALAVEWDRRDEADPYDSICFDGAASDLRAALSTDAAPQALHPHGGPLHPHGHVGGYCVPWETDAAPQAAGVTREVATQAEVHALPVGSVLARFHRDGSGPSVYVHSRDEGWVMATERISEPTAYPDGRDLVGNRSAPLTLLHRPVADAPAAPEGER